MSDCVYQIEKHQTTILSLPHRDVLLRAVFSKLSFKTLFSCRAVCRLFKELVDIYFQTLHEFDIERLGRHASLSNEDWNTLLGKCKNLRRITLKKYKKMDLEVLARIIEQNPLLESLDLSEFGKEENHNQSLDENTDSKCVLIALSQCCSNLVELRLSLCPWVNSSALVLVFKSCRKLEILDLSYNFNLNEDCLETLAQYSSSKLRYLDLRNCSFTKEALSKVCWSNPGLTFLDVSGSYNIYNETLGTIAKSCPNIEKLYLNNCPAIDSRGIVEISRYCLGLRCLDISYCSANDDCVYSLAQNCKELEELIVVDCFGLSRSGIAHLRCELPKCKLHDKFFWPEGDL